MHHEINSHCRCPVSIIPCFREIENTPDWKIVRILLTMSRGLPPACLKGSSNSCDNMVYLTDDFWQGKVVFALWDLVIRNWKFSSKTEMNYLKSQLHDQNFDSTKLKYRCRWNRVFDICWRKFDSTRSDKAKRSWISAGLDNLVNRKYE